MIRPPFFSFTFHRDYYRLISVVVSYQLIMRILRSEFNFDITLSATVTGKSVLISLNLT